MPRFRSNPLRGSVSQNFSSRSRGRTSPPIFTLGWRLALLVGSAAMLLLLGTWLWHSGWPERQADRLANASLRMTKKARFALKDITVKGRKYTSKKEILDALGVSAGMPILAIDLDAAHTRLTQLPWIESVSIKRQLPDTLAVRLTEREPMARWQNGGQITVIDRKGAPLTIAKPEDFASLLLVVGPDAPKETEALLTALKDFPSIRQVLKAAVRVGERRWNLHLQPGMIARLPEDGMAAALKRLAYLIQEQKVLERNIVAIDLRQTDRFFIEPGNPASVSITGESHP